MLLLIDANRDKVRLVQQDVGGHQHRVGEQAGVDVFRVLGAFVLELRHARQLSELRVARQYPGKLCVRAHMALDKQDGFFRIDTARHKQRQRRNCIVAQGFRLLADGHRMHVDD